MKPDTLQTLHNIVILGSSLLTLWCVNTLRVVLVLRKKNTHPEAKEEKVPFPFPYPVQYTELGNSSSSRDSLRVAHCYLCDGSGMAYPNSSRSAQSSGSVPDKETCKQCNGEGHVYQS